MNEAAFEIFYRETSGALNAYVRRVCGDAALAEDIVHESFIRFLDAKRGFAEGSEEENRGQRRAYLYRIATNLMRDHWRRERRHRDGLRAWVESFTGSVPHAAEQDFASAHDMERVFARLKPQERALLWLAHVEEADHAEIAAMLNLSAGSVRVLLHRARGKLAQLLQRKRLDV